MHCLLTLKGGSHILHELQPVLPGVTGADEYGGHHTLHLGLTVADQGFRVE